VLLVAAVVDILDIKWESLVSANKPRPVLPVSALRRFTTHRILRDVGVSAAFAGDALVQKLKSVCQQQMDNEPSSRAAASGNNPAVINEQYTNTVIDNSKFLAFYNIFSLLCMNVSMCSCMCIYVLRATISLVLPTCYMYVLLPFRFIYLSK